MMQERQRSLCHFSSKRMEENGHLQKKKKKERFNTHHLEMVSAGTWDADREIILVPKS